MSLFLSTSQSVSVPEIATQPQQVNRTQFQMRLITHTTALNENATLTSVKHEMRVWQDIISDRFGETRRKRQEANTSDLAVSVANKCFKEDQQTYDDYINVNRLFAKDVADLLQGTQKSRSIVVLLDSEQRIQRFMSVHLEVDMLYINTIFSAPWNVRMHGGIQPEHSQIAVKGVGTSLMAYAYRLAQQAEKKVMALKPLTNSFTFYKDHLKMTVAEDQSTLFYDVAKDSTPLPLQ